jgi:hypothetical protein
MVPSAARRQSNDDMATELLNRRSASEESTRKIDAALPGCDCVVGLLRQRVRSYQFVTKPKSASVSFLEVQHGVG